MMKATDYDTLSDLADLLATDAWVIYEYKVLGENQISLVLVRSLPVFGKEDNTA